MKHKYHDVIVAYANGNPIQYFVLDKNPEGKWCDYNILSEITPEFNSTYLKWRTTPKSIKKYQWIYKIDATSTYHITNNHYFNELEVMHRVGLQFDDEIFPLKESAIDVEEFDK